MLQLGNGCIRQLPTACRPVPPVAKPAAIRSVAGCGASRGRRAGHTHRAIPRQPRQSQAARPAVPEGSAEPPRRLSPDAPAALRPGQCASGRGFASRFPATASTNEGAIEAEYCRLGRKRHKPVSSIHVRASSNVSAPCPFWRILSARDASNCSAVKEKPHFQAGVTAYQGCCVLVGLFKGRCHTVALTKRYGFGSISLGVAGAPGFPLS